MLRGDTSSLARAMTPSIFRVRDLTSCSTGTLKHHIPRFEQRLREPDRRLANGRAAAEHHGLSSSAGTGPQLLSVVERERFNAQDPKHRVVCIDQRRGVCEL